MPPEPSGLVPMLPCAENAAVKMPSMMNGNRNVKNTVSVDRKYSLISKPMRDRPRRRMP
jgi:hypothetical protein